MSAEKENKENVEDNNEAPTNISSSPSLPSTTTEKENKENVEDNNDAPTNTSSTPSLPSTLSFNVIDSVSFILELHSGWYCYWDGSYSVPTDPSNYTFSSHLQLASVSHIPDSKFIYSPNFQNNFPDSPECRDIFTKLNDFHKLFQERGLSQHHICSESDYEYLPIVLPLSSCSATNVLELLGAHKEIKDSVVNIDLTDDHFKRFRDQAFLDDEFELGEDEPSEGIKLSRMAWDYVRGNAENPIVFYAGSEKLNPVPFFVLGQLSQKLVGGFMSVVIHT